MRKNGIATVIALSVCAYLLLFLHTYHGFICDKYSCTLFSHKGIFSKKNIVAQFKKSEIREYKISYSLKDLFVKTRYHKHGHNYHDEYRVSLLLYNNGTVELPFSFYDDRRKAEMFVSCIKDKPYCKRNDYLALFFEPWWY